MTPRCAQAAAAVAAVLMKKDYAAKQDVLASVEGVGETDESWWCVVVAQTDSENWELFIVWPNGDPSALAGEYDTIAEGMVIRGRGNALSHAEALLEALGVATGIVAQ